MLNRAEINVMLDSRGICWPLESGNVTIAALRTTNPLRMVVPVKNGIITIAGDIAFAGLGGLSGSSGKPPLQSGSLALRGELSDGGA